MLNVAVIRSVVYYLEQVTGSVADYHLGRGESPGRWAGSLADAFGLRGTVSEDALRAVLEGRDPNGGDPLVAGRPIDPSERPASTTAAPRADGTVTVTVAADLLGVSPRTVRRWIAAGETAWVEAQTKNPDARLSTAADVIDRLSSDSVDPDARRVDLGRCLFTKAGDRRGPRRVPLEEVDRLQARSGSKVARQGYDVVFRPAKGWSVLWAVAPPDVRRDILAIHHDAVADALRYLEDAAARGRVTVPWRGRRVRVRARGEGFLVACFDHRESRAGDPLLHTHCLIANLTRLPDGRVVALEGSNLFRQQLAADAVYRASFLHLAARRLGLDAVAGASPFPEPAGVPQAVIDRFSKRSDEIAVEVARHGSASAGARQLAALATRRAKQVAQRTEDLHERWRREAESIGFDRLDIAKLLGVAVLTPLPDVELAATFERLAAPGGMTAGGATFNRGEVIRALGDELGAKLQGGGLVVAAERFLANDAVIQVREHRPNRPRGRVLEAHGVVDDLALARFSVADLAATEGRLIAAAAVLLGPVVADDHIDAVLATHPRLTAEQANMVRSVSRSSRLIRPVVGLPGSGKTTAAGALADVFTRAGIPVVGCAVTATAAAELAAATGIRVCDTLARTLLDLEGPEGGLAVGSIVFVDEASMLPTRELDRLIGHVRGASGALVLIGDPHQHPAVGPGAYFAWLTQAHREVPHLSENQRRSPDADPADAAASAAMRDGRVADALRLRAEADQLTTLGSPAELLERMVDDWQADWERTRDPMIAASNAIRLRLNALARARLGAGGILHGAALVVGEREFRAGDWVIARHNDRRLRSRTDSAWWLRNGSSGEIISVDAATGAVLVDFTDRVAGGVHRIQLPSLYVNEHLDHGYAVTDYAVQGRTLSRARAVLDEASTLPGAYVATTRGRHENRFYAVDGDLLDTEGLDTSHGAPIVRAPSMDELAGRVGARRPDGMLHDRDPNVVSAAALASAWSAEELKVFLRRIDTMAPTVPGDPSASLRNAEAALARHNQSGGRRSNDSDEALARLEAAVERLRGRAERHRAAVLAESVWRQQRTVIVDALALRETKQRLHGPAAEALDVGSGQRS